MIDALRLETLMQAIGGFVGMNGRALGDAGADG
jgi:hypothetical protein